MPRRRNTVHTAPTSDIYPDAPKDVALVEFARRLQKLLVERGWSQSELARKMTIHLPADGPRKSIHRDLVSKYINGKTFPSADSLAAMAAAFGVEASAILPTRGIAGASPILLPAFDMRQVSEGRMHVRVNQEVDSATALKILELLQRVGGA